MPDGLRASLLRGTARVAAALERSTRGTLEEIITASRYAGWLAVAPIIAFLLLTAAARVPAIGAARAAARTPAVARARNTCAT